jgi:serine/threonine protein kinase
MSLAAGSASVNSLAIEGLLDRPKNGMTMNALPEVGGGDGAVVSSVSRSEHKNQYRHPQQSSRAHRIEKVSVTGAQLDLQWRQLQNVEYLTDGGNSWIHTAVLNGKPVVVKTLKPECQDVAMAINEIEGELAIHSRLNHPHIVSLVGAGITSKGVRFVVMERLDGGTLTQMLGYDTRIRDRRRRFWRRKQFSFLDVLRIARAIAEGMAYCHEEAIPGCIVLHRDLKPDNIGMPSLIRLILFVIFTTFCDLRC